jgi:hypothetical protein
MVGKRSFAIFCGTKKLVKPSSLSEVVGVARLASWREFKATCRAWRAGAPKPLGNTPFLMLSKRLRNDLRDPIGRS